MTTTLERPAESAGALYVKTPVTPEEIFRAIGRLRKEARDEIDRLMRFLDETDNHMELEPNGDEFDGNNEDEEDSDTDEDDDPAEPSLGSIERAEWTNQEAWAYSGSKDLEDEHDGAEPPEDDEPALGAYEGHDNQRVAWWVTSMMDYELDPAESGIGDLDGALEQLGSQDWQQGAMA